MMCCAAPNSSENECGAGAGANRRRRGLCGACKTPPSATQQHQQRLASLCQRHGALWIGLRVEHDDRAQLQLLGVQESCGGSALHWRGAPQTVDVVVVHRVPGRPHELRSACCNCQSTQVADLCGSGLFRGGSRALLRPALLTCTHVRAAERNPAHTPLPGVPAATFASCGTGAGAGAGMSPACVGNACKSDIDAQTRDSATRSHLSQHQRPLAWSKCSNAISGHAGPTCGGTRTNCPARKARGALGRASCAEMYAGVTTNIWPSVHALLAKILLERHGRIAAITSKRNDVRRDGVGAEAKVGLPGIGADGAAVLDWSECEAASGADNKPQSAGVCLPQLAENHADTPLNSNMALRQAERHAWAVWRTAGAGSATARIGGFWRARIFRATVCACHARNAAGTNACLAAHGVCSLCPRFGRILPAL